MLIGYSSLKGDTEDPQAVSKYTHDTNDPQAVSKYTHNHRAKERTPTTYSYSIDADQAYMGPPPDWTPRSIPRKPVANAQPAHQGQGRNWNGSESDPPLVPTPTVTQNEQPCWTARRIPRKPVANAQPAHQSQGRNWNDIKLDLLLIPTPTTTQSEPPSDTLEAVRDCTPASISTLSAVESEGERSFVHAMDYVDQFSIEPGDHILALALAQLSLQRCSQGSYRALQKTNTGSPGGSTSQSQQQSSNPSSSPSLPGTRSSIKRSFNSDKHPGGRDEAEDNKDSKKTRRSASGQSACNRLLACPYYRFDIGRYSERNRDEIYYRGCSSVCLRDISRLKQHLYRVHRRPDYYCGSCYCVLANQSELDAHTRQRPACDNAPPKHEEKIYRDQMNAIKRRTMGTDPIEEWFRIYAILFPGINKPPVSYVYADGDSSVAVQEYLTYFQAEAPSLLLELVRSQTDDRILLSEEQQNILNAAFEYATSRLVSRLRPELDEYGVPRPNLRDVLQPPGNIRPSDTLAQSAAHAEERSLLLHSDPPWSVIPPGTGDWLDLEQEEWLGSNLTDWEQS
jgi:hypothetical protein